MRRASAICFLRAVLKMRHEAINHYPWRTCAQTPRPGARTKMVPRLPEDALLCDLPPARGLNDEPGRRHQSEMSCRGDERPQDALRRLHDDWITSGPPEGERDALRCMNEDADAREAARRARPTAKMPDSASWGAH